MRKYFPSVLLLLPACLCGCGEKEIVITHYPSFYREDLKTIAVVPFRNATPMQRVGNILSDALAAQLAANGTYRIYNRNDLKILRDEQDLRTEQGLSNEQIAERFRNLADVDAILVGTVNTYAATRHDDPRTEQTPIWQYNPYTRQMYIAGYQTRQYVFTRNEGNVSVTAALIRVPDGGTIYATPSPVTGNFWAQGSPPPYDAYACLNQAVNQAVQGLVQTFAVTRSKIKVKEREHFRTAAELYDNKWTWKDTFKASDSQAYIVATLPKVCDRNRFRITILRRKTRKDIFAEDIVWQAVPTTEYTARGYAFSPQTLFAEGGPGEYEAKFYSGPEPVMRHTFRIDP